MRRLFVLLLALLAMISTNVALAQSAPLTRTIARGFTMAEQETVDFKLQCPSGYIPTGYSFTIGRTFDQYQQVSRELIDRNGAVVDRQALTNINQIDGGGYSVTLYNDSH